MAQYYPESGGYFLNTSGGSFFWNFNIYDDPDSIYLELTILYTGSESVSPSGNVVWSMNGTALASKSFLLGEIDGEDFTFNNDTTRTISLLFNKTDTTQTSGEMSVELELFPGAGGDTITDTRYNGFPDTEEFTYYFDYYTEPEAITLYANGGYFSSNNAEIITYTSLTSAQQVEVPVRDGYKFKGFYLPEYPSSYPIDEDGYVMDAPSAGTVLHAGWEVSSSNLCTLDTYFGYFESTSSVAIGVDWSIGNIPAEVEVPIAEIGGEFGGFVDENNNLYYDENGQLVQSPEYTTLPNILYATRKITLHAGSGIFSSNNSSELVVTGIDFDSPAEVEVPVYLGYIFKGFYIESPWSMIYDSNGQMVQSFEDYIDYNADISNLYAEWEVDPNYNPDPWDNVDESAPICQAYIDDTGTMYARNFRIHSSDTVIIDDLGDVYAKSFAVGDIMNMSQDGLVMKAFNLIREEGYNIRTLTDANNNIVVDNNNNVIIAEY